MDRLDDWIVITLTAQMPFLHHMVRNIAGVLMAIGLEVKKRLIGRRMFWLRRDRTSGGVTAPPDGLYLVNIQYPARFSIPESKSSIRKIWHWPLK